MNSSFINPLKTVFSALFIGLYAAALSADISQLTLFCVVCFLVYTVYRYVVPSKTHLEQFSFAQPKVSTKQLLCIVVSAIIAITLCSRSSMLYPVNGGLDQNCFFTVGKSMLYGKVPYRDLYEQKGPLVYMLYAVAALVSWKKFIGIYFLELISAGFFLFFSYELMQLYRKSISVLYVIVLAAIVYSSSAFHLGGQVEEFCLPFFAYTLFVGAKTVRTNQIPSRLECFIIGMTSACVLWMKFTLLGFYFGWACIPFFLLIRERRFKDLFQIVLWISIGILTLTLPIAIYFAANHAVRDLLTVYFYNNIFLYPRVEGNSTVIDFLRNLNSGLVNFRTNNYLSLIAILIGTMTFWKVKARRDFWFLLSSALLAFIFVYIGGRHYRYYSLGLCVFLPMGLVSVDWALQAIYKKYSLPRISPKLIYCSVCVTSIIFAYYMSLNTPALFHHKKDFVQYRFAWIIQEQENATLLNYGFLDGGFYTTTGIVPSNKFFCKLNIPLKEMMDEQNKIVEEGKVDFVVTRGSPLGSSLYEQVTSSGKGENTLYLYKLIKAEGT